jgi:hypothetical protein
LKVRHGGRGAATSLLQFSEFSIAISGKFSIAISGERAAALCPEAREF